VTQPVIERYQRWLYYFRRPSGRPLTLETQNSRLGIVKQFFRWLTRQHLTLFNPASEIELPRLSHRLPRDILTPTEAEAVLAVPNVETPLGIRDRAILETFYSTGLRRVELVNLALYDLDAARGTLMVREGKGRKDRVVPIGRRALDWIDKYLTDVRPHHVVDTDVTYLFLTIDGGSINSHMLGNIVKKYLKAAGIDKNGACHIWRHTVATAMLENGADIRFIQDLLGHADARTTQVYTRVSIKKLQEIHRATHPAERAYRELTEESGEVPDDERQVLDERAAPDDTGGTG
jgi:integrase/recombinase XerD